MVSAEGGVAAPPKATAVEVRQMPGRSFPGAGLLLWARGACRRASHADEAAVTGAHTVTGAMAGLAWPLLGGGGQGDGFRQPSRRGP